MKHRHKYKVTEERLPIGTEGRPFVLVRKDCSCGNWKWSTETKRTGTLRKLWERLRDCDLMLRTTNTD